MLLKWIGIFLLFFFVFCGLFALDFSGETYGCYYVYEELPLDLDALGARFTAGGTIPPAF